MSAASRRGTWLALSAIVALALVLRLIGLRYGLPAVYNPDEVAIMNRALSFARGTLNPQNFLYPTFFFYVLFAWVGAYLGFIYVTGRVASIEALKRLLFTDPTAIYTAGRTLGVVAGSVTVAAIFSLGARLTDTRTALAAAVFLAVAPLHVRDSHYVKHDVPATLAVVVAYLAMSRLWPAPQASAPRWRETVLAGAACGVAFSTHYYCIFLALPLALAIALGWRAQGLAAVVRQLAIGAAASAVTFFALSPFLLVEPMTAWRDITANRQIVVDRAVATGAFAPAARYAEMLWTDAAGVPIAVLAIIGCLAALRSMPARAAFLLAFPLPFLLFISNTAPASRYLNPVLPFMVLFAAMGVSTLASRVSARAPVFWTIAALAAAPALWSSLAADFFIRRDDTRTLAQRFIEANVPAGASVLIQPYSAVLTPSREGLVEALTANLGRVEAASIKFQLQLSIDPYPAPSYRLIYLGRGGLDAEKIYVDPAALSGADGLAALRRLGVTYVVVKRYNKPDPETQPLLAVLAREGRRLAVFSPYRPGLSEAERARIDPFLHNTDTRIDAALDRPGPPLEIWQLGVR
jgi:Dolichyl-phosphate-mannose-protein mannosyltransferase